MTDPRVAAFETAYDNFLAGVDIDTTMLDCAEFMFNAGRSSVEPQINSLRYERDQARYKADHMALLLQGIYALLYPPTVQAPDGKTYAFRPTAMDPHEGLQELSDRIRALPDQIALSQ